jgi:hypothetical protein
MYLTLIPGDSMLAYLDSLCAALVARDAEEIRRLLRHPLARALPRAVREEALGMARAGNRSLRAPLQTLRFYHQTAHLLGVQHDPASQPQAPDRGVDDDQMELPLRMMAGERRRA